MRRDGFPTSMRDGRAIHLVRLDKTRPAVVLTREAIAPFVSAVMLAFDLDPE